MQPHGPQARGPRSRRASDIRAWTWPAWLHRASCIRTWGPCIRSSSDHLSAGFATQPRCFPRLLRHLPPQPHASELSRHGPRCGEAVHAFQSVRARRRHHGGPEQADLTECGVQQRVANLARCASVTEMMVRAYTGIDSCILARTGLERLAGPFRLNLGPRSSVAGWMSVSVPAAPPRA